MIELRAMTSRFSSFALAFSLGVMLLVTPRPVSAQERQTVVIDAGHGGFDRGGAPG